MRILIWALLIPFAAWAADEKAPARKIDITYSLSGPEMYKTFCAPCHGEDGKGNGPVAAGLKTAPTDLTMLAKKSNGAFPRERVRAYIEGKGAKEIAAHGSREMPIWGDVFRGMANDPGAITYRLMTLTSYLETLQSK
jgi:mono/diheme cytochrome c family protein